MSISPSGSIHYSTDGGGSVSVSVGFPPPFGSVGLSLPLGRKVDGVSGYSVDITSPGRYKLYVRKTFEVRSYIIYKKVWVDDFVGYVWQEYSGGTTQSMKALDLEARKVG